MNILWLTNVPLPEFSQLMNEKPTPFGGWLDNASIQLSEDKRIKLSITFPKTGLNDVLVNDVLVVEGDKIKYYAFQPANENKLTNKLGWILDQVKPDIVHIFGTEYAHTLVMVNACNELGISTVISIQGLLSIYEKHYMACLPVSIQNSFTLWELVKQDSLKQQQIKFIKHGRLEIEALQKAKHIIGRTTWDKACTSQINPDAQYYFCNETLRNEFYKHRWEINRCEKHSVFISQGSYPIKGLHFMLEAMPLILKRFPEAKLYVGGRNPTKINSFIDRIKLSSYGKYIKKLISRYNLQDSVVFTDLLDEKQMCERYLRSHVFVCPSSIENSPNSLGEAMILGVPCVASDVGGVADMLKHRVEGFVYQSDAPYMLAYYICKIFVNDVIALRFSEKAREHALRTHDKKENLNVLLGIYETIIRCSKLC